MIFMIAHNEEMDEINLHFMTNEPIVAILMISNSEQRSTCLLKLFCKYGLRDKVQLRLSFSFFPLMQ